LFFLITDSLHGKLLALRPEKLKKTEKITASVTKIIEFSELIQNLGITRLSEGEDTDFRERFLNKTIAWYQDITDIYNLNILLEIVKNGVAILHKRTRHGDFTPWHLMNLTTGKIALIDGEHAMANGVEYYDIGYFIQRVFCVLQYPDLAKNITELLIKRNYNINTLKIILSARAIGGFLDESLKPLQNYEIHDNFKNWVMNLH